MIIRENSSLQYLMIYPLRKLKVSLQRRSHLLDVWTFVTILALSATFSTFILFSYCSNKCHAAYDVFNFLHLSVHVPAAPNMVKECVSNKASWKHLAAQKKWPTKAVLDWDQISTEELLILDKRNILFALAGCNMFTTNSAWRVSLVINHSISPAPW